MANVEGPILGISSDGDGIRITLDLRPPLATEQMFQAIVALLAQRLKEVREPSAGDLEIASWGGHA